MPFENFVAYQQFCGSALYVLLPVIAFVELSPSTGINYIVC
jgi:hypothetical protein